MLTGREAHTLPPALVRGLFWRVYARSIWSDDLVTAAHTTLPKGTTDVAILAAKGDAVKALAAVEAVLFPEDDDGE